jgi:hypothetical protein
LLIKLNIAGMRVAEVPVRAVYNVGEQSKMRIPRVVVPIVLLMFRRFVNRLFDKYILASGHPVVFAYLAAFLAFSVTLGLGVYIAVVLMSTGLVMKAALIAAGASGSIGFQALMTAFWMDYEANRHLCIQLGPPQWSDGADDVAPRVSDL